MTNVNSKPFAGQWVGLSRGDPDGIVIIDLDQLDSRAEGVAYLHPQDNGIPASFVTLVLPSSMQDTERQGDVVHFRGEAGYALTPKELSENYPDSQFPTKATIRLTAVDSNTITAEWRSDVGSFGEANLTRAEPPKLSKLASELHVKDWKSFQEHVTEGLEDGFIFRGQSKPYSLRTSFHRTSRRDLTRYLQEDVQRLHRALSGRTRHVFNLLNPQENGAFLSLAQHHGFPTPLLDWTYSPFVAAYFAYSGVKAASQSESVRILAFDQKAYRRKFTQLQTLTNTQPHFSVLEALSIENDRVGPQQGLLTLTNMTNIESFIEFQERQSKDRYLLAFDLPSSEADKALRDLALMGITRATLFPGIDSICSDQRDRYF